MRSRQAWVVIALALLVVLALLPVPTWFQRRSEAAASRANATTLDNQRRTFEFPIAQLTNSVQTESEVVMPALRLERAAEVLVTATQQHAYETALVDFVGTWPQPSCFSLRHDGYTVLGFNDQELLIPASLQKLMTAVGILEHLDPNETLVTRVLSDSAPVDGVLSGNIWVQGGGDPLLATTGYAASQRRQPQVFTPIEELVHELVALPITAINGRLIGDASRHELARFVESWPQRYRVLRNAGPLAALIVNDGLAAPGSNPAADLDPPREFVRLLGALLLLNGVDLEVTYGVGTAPADAVMLAEIHSPPVSEMLQQMLRESDNHTAEILLREVGLRSSGEGTTAAGALAVERAVKELLPDHPYPVVVDGSGLDRTNSASCAHFAELLDTFGEDSLLAQGLPVAASTGTLAHRFRNHPAEDKLAAKTGLLTGVNALAGFIETSAGTLTFAQIINGVPRGSRQGLELQVALVDVLLASSVDCSMALAELTAPWSSGSSKADPDAGTTGDTAASATICEAPEIVEIKEVELSEDELEFEGIEGP